MKTRERKGVIIDREVRKRRALSEKGERKEFFFVLSDCNMFFQQNNTEYSLVFGTCSKRSPVDLPSLKSTRERQ